jgi:hypothetical protein
MSGCWTSPAFERRRTDHRGKPHRVLDFARVDGAAAELKAAWRLLVIPAAALVQESQRCQTRRTADQQILLIVCNPARVQAEVP